MAGDPPLKGLRVLELAGLAPAPFCGLLLASYGASVLRIDRPHPLAHPPPPPPPSPLGTQSIPIPLPPPTPDLLATHKSSITLNLKHPPSRSLLLSLLPHTDILIDPFRPGILESLRLCPHSTLLPRNPGLIICRLTGFRRDGPHSPRAGHDINYLAASGVLSLLFHRGRDGSSAPPVPPANLLADFAGGGLVAFAGILLALLRRGGGVSGTGQVVDANMVDGVSFLATFARRALKTPLWGAGPAGTNLLDGGAPFYRAYATKDEGGFVAVGALEDRFWDELLGGLGLSEEEVLPPGFEGEGRGDRRAWPFMHTVFERRFGEKTRKEWEAVFAGRDACVTPVLGMAELEAEGYEQRGLVGLSESPGREVPEGEQWAGRGLRPGEGGEEVLRQWVGWRRGRDFDVHDGALVSLEAGARSKL